MKFTTLFALAIGTTEALKLKLDDADQMEHELTERIMNWADQNQDGSIKIEEFIGATQSEWKQICTKHQMTPEECDGYFSFARPFLRYFFHSVDTDNSNDVSRKELSAALNVLYPE